MRDVPQKFVNIPQGATCAAGIVTLGSFDEQNPKSEYRLRKLRVAPIYPYVEQLQMVLTTPGGIEVGPIDIPFTYNVETPVSGYVICPTASAGNQTIMLILSDLPDSPNLYGATHLVQPPQGVDTAIPDAAVACTPYPSTATLTFKDGSGNVIATATGPLLVARPRLAKTVASNSATPAILFHY